jgi:hypothetical protein
MRSAGMLLLYSIIIFVADTAVFVVWLMAPSSWRPRLHRLMLDLLSLALTVFGATCVSSGINPALGWLMIGVATFGLVVVPLRADSDRHARAAPAAKDA